MRRPTYATCAAIAAIVLTTASSATAARTATRTTKQRRSAPVVVTGANVKNATLTGLKFRNGSLSSRVFSYSSLAALAERGPDGAPGPLGDVGPQGNVGAKGKTGDKGAPAPRAYTFQTSRQSSRVGGAMPNPQSPLAPYLCSSIPSDDAPIGCAGGSGTPIRSPRWNHRCAHLGDTGPALHCATGPTSVPRLTRSSQSLIVTSNNASGGLLVMHQAGTIVLNASATFYTQRSRVNQRLECQLQVAPVENGVTQPPLNVGVPATVQRFLDASSDPGANNRIDRLLTISVTGAIAQPAGTYETLLACRAPDDTGTPDERLEFIEGNLSVLSTRSNGSIGG